MNTPKPLLLCILDGWGIGDEGDFNNAIARAKTPNYDRILKTYPHSRLETSGLAVGLPEGQIGNSEVGHMTIGAGRVIFQDLPRINNAIKDGSLAQHPLLQKLILSSSAFHPDSPSCHPESHSCHPERSEGSQDATRDLSASLRDDKERDDKEREDKERDEKGIKNDKRRV